MNTMSLFNLNYLSVKIVPFFPFLFNHLNIFLVWIAYFCLVFVLFLLISYLGLVLWLICNTLFFPLKLLGLQNVICLQTKGACFFVWLTLLCQTVFMLNLLSKLIEPRRVINWDFLPGQQEEMQYVSCEVQDVCDLEKGQGSLSSFKIRLCSIW